MATDGAFRVRRKESSFDESLETNIQEIKVRPLVSNAPPSSPDRSTKIVLYSLVAAFKVLGVIIIALVVYWCKLYGGFASWASDAKLQLNAHPLLIILGLILCYGDAIIMYRMLYFLPKWILKPLHAAFHLAAIVLSALSLVAVFENHRRVGGADMYSLHSWIGIGTFSAFCLQYIIGFVVFLIPAVPVRLRALSMPFHIFFGLGIFVLAVASALMGIVEKLLFSNAYFDEKDLSKTKATVGNVLGLFLVIYAFIVIYIATHSKFKRQPLPTDT